MTTLETNRPAEATGIISRPPGGYKQRLVLQVVWHPDSKRKGDIPAGRELAEYLYSLLTCDIDEPLARGIGIPVYFRSTRAPGKTVPEAFELDDAHHTVIVVLIDAKMVIDGDWGAYVANACQRVAASNARHKDERHRVIPVALSPSALKIERGITTTNFIRLFEADPADLLPTFAIGVAHELCRVLKQEPSINYTEGTPEVKDSEKVRIFISHAKVGNEQGVVKKLRDLLRDCSTKQEQRDVDDIINYFKNHADDDPSTLRLDTRYQSDAKPGKEQDLASGLRELFLAYAKLDRGKAIAEAVSGYINSKLQLNTFFDAKDILYGTDFAKEIEEFIHRSALLIIQTDAYSSRVWCQIEVLLAKRHRRPVLLVNAVRSGERRAFPYLGNVPTIRYSGSARPNYATIVAHMVLEVVHTLHFQKHFEDLRALFGIGKEIQVLTLSPELLTLLDLRREKKAAQAKETKQFVYPDPPLSDDELDLLHLFDEDLTVTTPIFLLGTDAKSTDQAAPETTATTGPTPKLHGRTVGVSISNSPDVGRFAMSNDAHLSEAAAGFSRYLLASGAALAYGGDFRAGGFTEQLLDLVRMHNSQAKDDLTKSRLRSFLAWPLNVQLDEEEQALYTDVAEFISVQPPADLKADDARPPGWDTPEDRYTRARCFTAMRERMNTRNDDGRYAVDARVFLGGPLYGHKSKYPGLFEEAYLALRDGIPVYLIGGFGGCTLAIIHALLGKAPRRRVVSETLGDDVFDKVVVDLEDLPQGALDAFSIKEQSANTPGYAELVDQYQKRASGAPGADPIDYDKAIQEIRAKGLAGLNNGLSDEENLRLFTTPFVVEMIRLVLLGLSRARYRT